MGRCDHCGSEMQEVDPRAIFVKLMVCPQCSWDTSLTPIPSSTAADGEAFVQVNHVDKVDMVTGAVDNCKLQMTIADLERDKSKLLNEVNMFRRKSAGEIWAWQDDEEDHPESLACPVLVQADVIRRFVAAEAAFKIYEARESTADAKSLMSVIKLDPTDEHAKIVAEIFKAAGEKIEAEDALEEAVELKSGIQPIMGRGPHPRHEELKTFRATIKHQEAVISNRSSAMAENFRKLYGGSHADSR